MRILIGLVAVVWIFLYGMGLYFHGWAPGQVLANALLSESTEAGVYYSFPHNRFECLLLFGGLPITTFAFVIFSFAMVPHRADPTRTLVAAFASLLLGGCFVLFAHSLLTNQTEFKSVASIQEVAPGDVPVEKRILDSSIVVGQRIRYSGLGICCASILLLIAVTGKRPTHIPMPISTKIGWGVLSFFAAGQILASVFAYQAIHDLYSKIEANVSARDPIAIAEGITQYFTTAVLAVLSLVVVVVIFGIIAVSGRSIGQMMLDEESEQESSDNTLLADSPRLELPKD